ncbi:MAG: BrnT family toxin [Candidatus Obscuribacterales bacterium]|nr:BrnT family toxin [Candidatus Obscuribacterales bacterium]
MTIRFEWDELKNQRNIIERGLDFADAIEVINNPAFIQQDKRKEYGEDRFIAGGLSQGRFVFAVYTVRSSELVRIISFRKANRRERKRYEEKI